MEALELLWISRRLARSIVLRLKPMKNAQKNERYNSYLKGKQWLYSVQF
jgi:hypothetical protein